jgi:hypothetical protein
VRCGQVKWGEVEWGAAPEQGSEKIDTYGTVLTDTVTARVDRFRVPPVREKR